MHAPIKNPRVSYTFTDLDIKAAASSGGSEHVSGRTVMLRNWVCSGDFPHDNPLWKQMVSGKRSRDPAWHRAHLTFQIAYVWLLLRLEIVLDQYIERTEDLENICYIIAEALRRRPHGRQIPFKPLNADELRNCRPCHESTLRGLGVESFNWSHANTREALLGCVGQDDRWWDVVRAVHLACADSARSIDPDLSGASTTADIERLIHRISAERGFHDFDPDTISISTLI